MNACECVPHGHVQLICVMPDCLFYEFHLATYEWKTTARQDNTQHLPGSNHGILHLQPAWNARRIPRAPCWPPRKKCRSTRPTSLPSTRPKLTAAGSSRWGRRSVFTDMCLLVSVPTGWNGNVLSLPLHQVQGTFLKTTWGWECACIAVRIDSTSSFLSHMLTKSSNLSQGNMRVEKNIVPLDLLMQSHITCTQLHTISFRTVSHERRGGRQLRRFVLNQREEQHLSIIQLSNIRQKTISLALTGLSYLRECGLKNSHE